VTDEASASVARAEPFLRLSLGWQVFRPPDERATQLFEAWAERVGPCCDAVGADVGPIASRLRCWAEGSSDDVIPVLAPLLAEAGATQDDLDLVTEIGGAVDPDRLGSWVEVDGADRSIGWQLGHLAASQLPTWLPWADALDAAWEVRRWSRSVGPAPFDVVEVAVPGSGDAAVAAATQALASCGVTLPPDAVIGALARHADDGVGVAFVAREGALVGGGIDVASTEVAALIDVLHALGGAEREVDRVARFRGAAGEPALLGIGAMHRRSGIDAAVRLRLA
jgi:hypothetical protein